MHTLFDEVVLDEVEPRDYQSQLMAEAWASIEVAARRRLMVQLETGGGKTFTAGWMLRDYLAWHQEAVCGWIAHREELLDQAEASLVMLGVPVHRISAAKPGARQWQTGAVNLFSVQTDSLPPLPPKGATLRFLVVDEAHHSFSPSYRKKMAEWRTCLGLSATPWRMSNHEALSDVWDDMICGPKYTDLVKLEALAPYEIVTPTQGALINRAKLERDEFGEITSKSSTVEVMRLLRSRCVLDEWRDAVTGLNDKRTLWFMPSVDACSQIAAYLTAAGETVGIVHGKTKKSERTVLIDGFERGNITHLVNVAVATEGFDVPECAVVVHMRPTDSLGLHRQINGRALRWRPGKTAVIIDCAANNEAHGEPDAYIRWSLARRQARTYGEAPEAKCPECGWLNHLARVKCANVVCGMKLQYVCGEGTADGCGRQRRYTQFGGVWAALRPGALCDECDSIWLASDDLSKYATALYVESKYGQMAMNI